MSFRGLPIAQRAMGEMAEAVAALKVLAAGFFAQQAEQQGLKCWEALCNSSTVPVAESVRNRLQVQTTAAAAWLVCFPGH